MTVTGSEDAGVPGVEAVAVGRDAGGTSLDK